MDYMPEFYSSNVNPAPKAEVKSVISDRQPSNLIYFLKEEEEINGMKKLEASKHNSHHYTNIMPANSMKNQIQKDLLLLLKQQPHKFLSLSFVNKFNCTDKQNGIHRDPTNCEKFYICNNNTKSNNLKANAKLVNQEAELMKEFKCPANTSFTMNGCFCEKKIHEHKNEDDFDDNINNDCHRLDDTFCRKL